MSVRSLCDAACRLGMDPKTCNALALYEGVLAADADALQVIAWAQAVADELQSDADAEERASVFAEMHESNFDADDSDRKLWNHDNNAEIERVMTNVAQTDERRRTLEDIHNGFVLTDHSSSSSSSVANVESSQRRLNGLVHSFPKHYTYVMCVYHVLCVCVYHEQKCSVVLKNLMIMIYKLVLSHC